MISTIPRALGIFAAAAFASASLALPHEPLRIASDTICAGRSCDAVLEYGSLIAPALSDRSTAGRLLARGEDPLAPCLERLDREKVPQVASCVARRLGWRSVGESVAEAGHDVYMVLVLANDRGQGVAGEAVFVTRSGQTFRAHLHMNPYEIAPDGMVSPTRIESAKPDEPIILTFYGLPEAAAYAGLHGFPPHRPLIEWSSPRGSGTHYGTLITSLSRRPVRAPSPADVGLIDEAEEDEERDEIDPSEEPQP